MGLQKQIKNEMERISKIIETIQNNQTHYPEGQLRCSKTHQCHQYYINGRYVRKSERKRAIALAQRDYENDLLKLLTSVYSNLQFLRKVYDDHKLEKVYTELCESRKALISTYFPDKEKYVQAWTAKEYEHWDIESVPDFGEESKPEEKKYKVTGEILTVKGEHVRSKSEKIIADEFTRCDIPYRYEYPLSLKSWNKMITIRPDFLVLNKRTLQEYIVEHLGMMDKADYYNRTMDKLELYEKNGYLIGRNLIILHETSDHPLNMRILDKYIEEYLL